MGLNTKIQQEKMKTKNMERDRQVMDVIDPYLSDQNLSNSRFQSRGGREHGVSKALCSVFVR